MSHPTTQESQGPTAEEKPRPKPPFFERLWTKLSSRLSDKLASIGVSFVLVASTQFFNSVKDWDVDPAITDALPGSTGTVIAGIWVAFALMVFFIQPKSGPLYLRTAYTFVLASCVTLLSALYLDARTKIHSFESACEATAEFNNSAERAAAGGEAASISGPCAALAEAIVIPVNAAEGPKMTPRKG